MLKSRPYISCPPLGGRIGRMGHRCRAVRLARLGRWFVMVEGVRPIEPIELSRDLGRCPQRAKSLRRLPRVHASEQRKGAL